MSTWRILVTVLLLIHPALSQHITTTCEIPSVEAGENATLTVHFGQDLRQEEIRDFSLEHIGHSSTASQTKLLECEFSYGNVTCDKTSCCTWESHVMDVFRVYIHNVSQELEGRFWGFVIPGSTEYQKSCNFSLKAPTCRTDTIIATNSDVICKNQPVTIGQTCIVTCSPDHYFQENQTSVTYTCIGKNKWSPEIMVTVCEGQKKGQATSSLYYLFLLLLLLIPIVIFFIWWCRKTWERRQKLKEELLRLKEATNYWLACIRKWYPELQSRTYFLPPLPSNRGQFCQQSVDGYPGPVLQTPKDCDVGDDRVLQRVLLCIRILADNSQQKDNAQQTDNPQETDNHQETDKLQQADNPQQKEVMMIISQLQFGKHIGQPSYATAVTLLPLYSKRSGLFQRYYDEDDCDVLIIHKTLGLLTLQITSVGENFNQLEMTEQEQDDVVMNKVKEAVKQLNKAEADLKHLTSDMVNIKQITKILVLPSISSNQLLRAIKRFPSDAKLLRECLGAKSVDDAVQLCLLSDQLSDNQTPSDINHSSLQALREWWQHIRASRSGSSLTSSLYEQLVARFCGPATTVEVHCIRAPRLTIGTLGEVMSETGERVARLVLVPQQVDILNQSPPQAFLSGPPGTGKTIVLIMQGLTWIQSGYDVHVVSTWDKSRAVTIFIKHQLQETVKTSTARSRVQRHQIDFWKDGEVETAVSRLKSLSEGRQLCVIVDEVMRDDRKSFTKFYDQLVNEVPGVYIWGASLYHDVKPLRLITEFKLTTPLRSPPVVVRKVMEARQIKDKQVDDYTVSDVPVPTDGPPVMRIKHSKGQSGHREILPCDCVECGHQVARVLKELDVGRTGDSNGSPPLQYRDVLVVCVFSPTDDQVDSYGEVTRLASGLVRGLRNRLLPVRVVKECDKAAIRDMALGVSDLVTVANWNDVRGLERKVVVVASGTEGFDRLHAMSRCTSQLVLIDR